MSENFNRIVAKTAENEKTFERSKRFIQERIDVSVAQGMDGIEDSVRLRENPLTELVFGR